MEGDEGILELVGTRVEDVEVVEDAFVPWAREGSLGVRIRIKN